VLPIPALKKASTEFMKVLKLLDEPPFEAAKAAMAHKSATKVSTSKIPSMPKVTIKPEDPEDKEHEPQNIQNEKENPLRPANN